MRINYIILFIVIGACSCREQNSRLNIALKLMDSSRNEEAISILDDLINNSTIEGKLYFHRSQAYYNLGNYNKAFSDINEAFLQNWEKAETFNQRGLVKLKFDSVKSAVQDFLTAIELDSHYVIYYHNLALAYNKLGENDSAFYWLKKGLKLDPSSGPMHNLIGVVFKSLGDLEYSLGYFNKAIELEPSYAEAYINRATVYLEEGRFEDAVDDLNSALDYDSKQYRAFYLMGFVEIYHGDTSMACEYFNFGVEENIHGADSIYSALCKNPN